MTTKINFAIKSTKGKRAINQDSLVCTYNHNSDFLGICCDGIGSIKYSEIASKTICSVFALEFEKTYQIEKPIIWVKQTLAKALNKLKYAALSNNIPGIATTMALLLVINNKYYAFNIGDTRIYGINGKTIIQLTYDHNYYNYLVKKQVSKKVLEENKNKWFALTRYIEGDKPAKAKLDYVSGNSDEYKYFIICTDGLYGYVEKDKITKVINNKVLPLVIKSSRLNHLALKYNSTDNVSNILVRCRVHGK